MSDYTILSLKLYLPLKPLCSCTIDAEMQYKACEYGTTTVYDVIIKDTALVKTPDQVILAEGGLPTFNRVIPKGFLGEVHSRQYVVIDPMLIEFSDLVDAMGVTPSPTSPSVEDLEDNCTWNWVVCALVISECFMRYDVDERSDEEKQNFLRTIAEVLDTRGGCYEVTDGGEKERAIAGDILVYLHNIMIIGGGDDWENGHIALTLDFLRLIITFFRRQVAGGTTSVFNEGVIPIINDITAYATKQPPSLLSASVCTREDKALWELFKNLSDPDLPVFGGKGRLLFDNRPSLKKQARHGHQLVISLLIALASRVGVPGRPYAGTPLATDILPDEANLRQLKLAASCLTKVFVMFGFATEGKNTAVSVLSFIDDVTTKDDGTSFEEKDEEQFEEDEEYEEDESEEEESDYSHCYSDFPELDSQTPSKVESDSDLDSDSPAPRRRKRRRIDLFASPASPKRRRTPMFNVLSDDEKDCDNFLPFVDLAGSGSEPESPKEQVAQPSNFALLCDIFDDDDDDAGDVGFCPLDALDL